MRRIAREFPATTRVTAPLLLAMALFTLSNPSALWAGEEVEIEGVLHVRNGESPEQGLEAVQLRELWRAGGEDDEIFFGFVGQVLGGPDGNIYLMDTQLSEVHVYSPEGEHLRILGREGDGPGETRRPGDIFFTPEGHLGMMQTFPGKVVLVDLEGNPAGSLDFDTGDPNQGRFAVLVRGINRGDYIVLGGIRMTFGQDRTSNQTYFLSTCDATGKEKVRLLTKEYAINYSDFSMDELGMDFTWGRCDLAPDGRVFTAPHRNKYEIHVFNQDGSLDRIIEREYKSLARDEEDKQQAYSIMEGVAAYYPAPPREITVEDMHADISTLYAREDGNLWVRTSRGDLDSPEGVLGTIDVFDGKGHLKKQVALKGPGNLEQDNMYMIGKDRVVIVTGAVEAFRTMQGVTSEEDDEEAAPLEVICYQMSPMTAKG